MESQQPALWAVLWITFVPATICIILRLMGRRITKIPLWWDDYCAIAGYVTGIVWTILTPIWIEKGLGLHIQDVKGMPEAQEQILFDSKLLLYVAELFYAFALFFAKMSILCFYWRMFRVSNIKLPIQILMGCSIVWIIIRTIMGVFHCEPIDYFWDSSIEDGYCAIDDSKFFFGSILVHVIIDLCIISLPVIQIRKLQLPLMQRIGVMVMFMFGIFIIVAALVIIVISTTFDATSIDFTWNISPIVLWATVEVNLVTVSTCLPTVKPATYYIFGWSNSNNSALRSGSNSYGFSQTKKSIKLSTVPNGLDNDGSSSTHQLGDDGDFDSHAVDGPSGLRTYVVGHDREPGPSHAQCDSDMRGIMVKNETFVEVSRNKRVKSPFDSGDSIDS